MAERHIPATYENGAEFEESKPDYNSYEQKLQDLYESTKKADVENLQMVIRKCSDGPNSKTSFCESFPADKFSIEEIEARLARNFGPGDYRLQVRVGNVLKINHLVTIAENARTFEHGENPDSISGQLIARMDRQDNLLRELYTSRNDDGGNSRMDFLSEMMLMKDLFTGNQPQQSSLTELVTLMVTLKDSGLMGEGGNNGDSFTSFLTSMTPALTKILSGSADMQQIEQLKRLQNSQRQQGGADNMGFKDTIKKAGAKVAAKLSPEMQQLMTSLDMLLNAARAEKNPELYAELLLDNIPDQYLGFVYQADDIIPLLKQIAPDRAAAFERYAPWIVDLHAEFKRLVDEDTGEENLTDSEITDIEDTDYIESTATHGNNNAIDGDSKRASGDAGNASPDEKTGSGIQEKPGNPVTGEGSD